MLLRVTWSSEDGVMLEGRDWAVICTPQEMKAMVKRWVGGSLIRFDFGWRVRSKAATDRPFLTHNLNDTFSWLMLFITSYSASVSLFKHHWKPNPLRSFLTPAYISKKVAARMWWAKMDGLMYCTVNEGRPLGSSKAWNDMSTAVRVAYLSIGSQSLPIWSWSAYNQVRRVFAVKGIKDRQR